MEIGLDAVLLVARVLLAAVFIVAGTAKVADLKVARQAVRDFGVPDVLARPLGLLLPLVELAVGIALIPTLTAWWGAIGALVLLALFVVGIGVNLARGKTPDCHCFGQLHSAPAGWTTMARNGVLGAVAALVVASGRNDPGASAVSWVGGASVTAVVGVIAAVAVLLLVAVETWFLFHLVQQNGRMLTRLEHLEGLLIPRDDAPSTEVQSVAGLQVGTQAPAFTLAGLHGETLTLGALLTADKPVMLLFSDPECGPCTALLPEVGRWQREHSETMTLAVITRGSVEANRAKTREHGITTVLLQDGQQVSLPYQVNGTPSAVVVSPDGTIASPVAGGADAIRNLVARTIGRPRTVPLHPVFPQNGSGATNRANGVVASTDIETPNVGAPAPDVELRGLDGQRANLAAFFDQRTVALFWNPGCGFCVQMLNALKEWERNPPGDAPRLLVISTGDAKINREMGLRSPVLLDDGFAAGRAFGAAGTPSAILIDADGKVASPLAAGADAVLELCGHRQAAR